MYDKIEIKITTHKEDGSKSTSGIIIPKENIQGFGVLRSINMGIAGSLRWIRKRDMINETLPYLETISENFYFDMVRFKSLLDAFKNGDSDIKEKFPDYKELLNDSASTLQKLFRREIEKEEAWRNEDIKEEIAFPEGQSA